MNPVAIPKKGFPKTCQKTDNVVLIFKKIKGKTFGQDMFI